MKWKIDVFPQRQRINDNWLTDDENKISQTFNDVKLYFILALIAERIYMSVCKEYD